MKKILPLLLFALVTHTSISAQEIGIKTNLLYDATTTLNFGVEVGIAPQWTIDLSANYNPWTLNSKTNRKLKHFLIQPEARYWLCHKFKGHFFGANAGYIQYNFSSIGIPFVKNSNDYRYQGWGAGVGVSYGYSVILGMRWNLEATLGVGVVYTRYDKYKCGNCGEKIKDNISKTLFAPTKAGITLIYLIKY